MVTPSQVGSTLAQEKDLESVFNPFILLQALQQTGVQG